MRFDHVKVLTREIEGLARFYEEALDCEPLSPVMDLSDESLRRGLGTGAGEIRMVWLSLPPAGEGFPTLELYQLGSAAGDWPFQPGQAHLSFRVDDVDQATERVLSAGGTHLGEKTDWVTPSGAVARFVYLRDPEGNVVDLWGRSGHGS